MALRRLWRLNPLFGVIDDMVEYGEDYTDAATVIEGMKTAYTVGKGYAKEVVEPEEAEAQEGDAEAQEGDAEAQEGDAEAQEGEQDGQQDENEVAVESADQPDQANASEIAKPGDADAALAQNSDSETALMQDDLPKILGESQMVLSGLTENRAEFAGAMPTSLEKGTADMKALQAPVGGNVQAQGATNRDEKTELNQVPAWRPARMDFRKK